MKRPIPQVYDKTYPLEHAKENIHWHLLKAQVNLLTSTLAYEPWVSHLSVYLVSNSPIRAIDLNVDNITPRIFTPFFPLLSIRIAMLTSQPYRKFKMYGGSKTDNLALQ